MGFKHDKQWGRYGQRCIGEQMKPVGVSLLKRGVQLFN